ncbi:hypothetical protein R3P38DRAFT_2768798 [Favolaschia claudopus]|uniref:Uncharacterized protein n=1 Tax=Favolaschia claudopus TaxID=2862362 RepID=A0AAW0CLF4_9AGAR
MNNELTEDKRVAFVSSQVLGAEQGRWKRELTVDMPHVRSTVETCFKQLLLDVTSSWIHAYQRKHRLWQLFYATRDKKFGNPALRSPNAHQIKLIAGYPQKLRFLTPRGQESLGEIERDVDEQLKTIHAASANIAAILFLCGDRHLDPNSFPFKANSSFLGLSGTNLFTRLTVVPPVADGNWGMPLESLANEGMCIISLANRSEIPVLQILSRISLGISYVREQIEGVYRQAAAKNRRNAGQVVILLVEETLHGKSKTINRLVGRDLLAVSTTAHGSITKVIERVTVCNPGCESAASITVAFDDTPRFRSTTQGDRGVNDELMRRYKRRYFDHTYPNVILLVASWDSIIPYAEHPTPQETNVVGRSMQSLRNSGLVDEDRVNVVVVVTKSLSCMAEFSDHPRSKDKEHAWMARAKLCSDMISKLQAQIIPGSPSWETVFIENGGGKDMTAEFLQLPDGRLSHQNLYNAIQTLVQAPGAHGIRDLAGIQALQILAGAGPLGPNVEINKQLLVTPSPQRSIEIPSSCLERPSTERTQIVDSQFTLIRQSNFTGAVKMLLDSVAQAVMGLFRSD